MLNNLGNVFGVLIGLALCAVSLVGIFQIIASKDDDPSSL